MEERDKRGRGAATVHVDEYLQMAQAGILNEEDRVELLDGERIGRTNAVRLPRRAMRVGDMRPPLRAPA